MANEPIKLQFGLSAAVPPTAKAAWGARLIFPNDLLMDRQGFHNWSTDEGRRLQDWLNVRGALREALYRAGQLAMNRSMSSADNSGFVLYEDQIGIVIGNPLASYGYLYIAAYLKEEANPAAASLIPAIASGKQRKPRKIKSLAGKAVS